MQGHTSFLVYTCICKWNIFLTSIKSIISTVKTKKNRQICRFLTENILQWWGKMQPTIKHFSQKYLAIPASYVPSKRVFSLVGHLVNKKRACHKPSNFGNIISWIKTWNTTKNVLVIILITVHYKSVDDNILFSMNC